MRLLWSVLLLLVFVPSAFAAITNADLHTAFQFEDSLSDPVGGDTLTAVGSATYNSSGKHNKAIDLGTASYLFDSTYTKITSATATTYSFWVYPQATFAGGIEVVNNASNNQNRLGVTTVGGSDFTTFGVGSTAQYATFTGDYTTNAWTHICLVYDGTQATPSNRVKIWEDGVAKSQTFNANPPTALASTLGTLFVGKWQQQGATTVGLIDEFYVFNKALTEAECQTLAAGDSSSFYPFSSAPVTTYLDVDAQDADTLASLKTFDVSINGNTHRTTNSSITFDGLQDSSGNNVTIVNTSIEFVSGVRNTGIELDASGDEVSLGTPTLTNAFTFAAWINSSGSFCMDPFTIRQGFTGAVGIVCDNSVNGVRFGASYYPGSNQYFLDNNYFANNTWHHVVVTFSSSGFLRSYVNGVANGQLAATGANTMVDVLTIGKEFVGQNFIGQIDEAMLFDVELNSSQVQALYLNSNQFTDNMILYASFDQYNQSSGNAAVNASAPNYFTTRYASLNLSVDFTANLTQYPFVAVHDDWNNRSLNATVVIDGNTYYTNNRSTFVPFNTSELVQITVTQYFARNLTHNFAGATDLNASVAQSRIRFQAIEIITGAQVSSANFTINGVRRANGEIFNLSAGIYTVTFSAAGYFNKSQSVTVSALDDRTINVTDVSGSILRIRAREAFLNTSLNAFNVTISSDFYTYSANYTTTVGEINISVLQSVAFNYSISADGYLTDVVELTSNVQRYNYTAYLYRDNALRLHFFDEETLLPVNNVSFTIYSVDGPGYGLVSNTSATNYTILIENIPAGFYGIEYSTGNYTIRNYFINIPLSSTVEANLTLYLLEGSSASNFVATVTDTNTRPLQGVYASLLRRYVINGQTEYRVVEMFKPSFSLQGAAPFTAVPNTVAYLFRVQTNDGTVLYQGAAADEYGYETLFLIDSQLFLQVQTGGSAFDVYQDLNGFSYTLTNTTGLTFWLSWSDTQNAITQICLQVKANETTVISNQCSTGDSGILSYVVPASNSTYYVARTIVTATADGEARTIALRILNYDVIHRQTTQLFGNLGLFMLVLVLMVAAVAGAYNPPVGVMIAVLSLIAFSPTLLGLAYVSLIMQGTIFVVGVIVAVLLGRRDG